MSNIKSFYTVVGNDTVPYNAIRLNETTPWPGFIYSYGKMQFLGENSDGTATVKFDYNVEVPGPVSQEDLQQPEFNKLLGDILIDLVEEGYGSKDEDC